MKEKCELIALTGGPGAGKTAVLEFIRKTLCEHIVILPEAAGIIFSGGFWRLDSTSARLAAQKAIFHVQDQMENLVLNEGKWRMGLCDRGTLDGMAYWPGSEGSFWKAFNTTKEEEYKRYKAIIHLRTPDYHNGYNHQNPLRVETADEASIIDSKIHDIWKDHPHYHMINSSNTFLEKMNKTIKQIEALIPKCCDKTLTESA